MIEAPTAGPPAAATLFLLAASPLVGSFLATVAYRLPRGRSAAAGRSACPSCGHALGAAELVPVVGYLVRRGRCAHCGSPIPRDYPLIELAALGAALWAVTAVPGWTAWAVAMLGWGLLALAAIDLKHFLLPDALTLPLLGLGLAFAALGAVAPGLGWSTTPLDAAAGAVAGFAAFALIGWLYGAVRKRTGIGGGDAKLLAAAGAWAGWQALPSVVLIAALSGLAVSLVLAAVRRRRPGLHDRLAFGPYLALGTWLVVLYGPLSFRIP
jgi:leader peptidase (prepilin peptidase)/N-methyltransferase